jgi:hypothetical protein
VHERQAARRRRQRIVAPEQLAQDAARQRLRLRVAARFVGLSDAQRQVVIIMRVLGPAARAAHLVEAHVGGGSSSAPGASSRSRSSLRISDTNTSCIASSAFAESRSSVRQRLRTIGPYRR